MMSMSVNLKQFGRYDGNCYRQVDAVMLQVSPEESECVEVVWDADLSELRVMRHGMDHVGGGTCVYSELFEPVPA